MIFAYFFTFSATFINMSKTIELGNLERSCLKPLFSSVLTVLTETLHSSATSLYFFSFQQHFLYDNSGFIR